MLNEKDIYNHLANGGDPAELYKALEKEVQAATDRIIKEKDAELKAQEAKKKEDKARIAAHKAVKSYCALVNLQIDDKMIDVALDILKDFHLTVAEKVKRGSRDKGIVQGITLSDDEWREIWNTVFPIHFRGKK